MRLKEVHELRSSQILFRSQSVDPTLEVIGMKAVVVNSIVYSLSRRCSFAQCLGIPARGCGGLDFGERGERNSTVVLRQRPVRRASSAIHGGAGSCGTRLERKNAPTQTALL